MRDYKTNQCLINAKEAEPILMNIFDLLDSDKLFKEDESDSEDTYDNMCKEASSDYLNNLL